MARFQGSIGSDWMGGGPEDDEFSAAGGGDDIFRDHAGGADSYLVYRADNAAYFQGSVTVDDVGTLGDLVDLTDFVDARRGAGLGVTAEGNDLLIRSGTNLVRLVDQLLPGNAGVELVQYSGSPLEVGDLDSAEAFETALRGLVNRTDRGLIRVDSPGVTLVEDSGTTRIALDAYVADQDGDAVSFALRSSHPAGAARIAGGSLLFTPLPDATGDGILAIRAQGHSSGRLDFELPIEVTPVNDAPRASDDRAVLGIGAGSVVIKVLANDFDADGDALRVSEVIDTTAVTILGDGTLRYDRTAGQGALDQFQYVVSDPDGASAIGLVRVEILPLSGGPTAHDDQFTASSLKKLAKSLKLDVLRNDTSQGGRKAIDRGSIELESPPDHGVVTIKKGKFIYQADADFPGRDEFHYSVADSAGRRSDLATVVIEGPAAS